MDLLAAIARFRYVFKQAWNIYLIKKGKFKENIV